MSLRGNDGLSAFELWQDQGHDGNESEFLEWLRGEDGKHTISYEGGKGGGSAGLLNAGGVGRLDSRSSVSGTDDVIILRDSSLFRISVTDYISTLKNYIIKSQDYELELADYYVEMDTASTTATLLTSGIIAGKECHIDNSSSGSVDVTPVGSESEILTLLPCEGSYLVYNGTYWRIK
jgi:hypothetical protein